LEFTEFVIENCVKKVRMERNETQQQLADAIGTTRQTIIKIEKGRIPSVQIMFAIARHYKLPINKLFFIASNAAEEQFA